MMTRRRFRGFGLLMLVGLLLFGGWGDRPAHSREEIPANNDVSLLIRVERGGRLWSLTDLPALLYGDILHVQLTNAPALHPEFPHVVRQRLNSMPSDHGLMVLAVLARASDRSGLGDEAFAEPFLSRDGKELLFRVLRDDVTPFLLMVPAIYDGKREGEWKDLREDIRKKPELKPLRDYLLRDFEAASVGGEVGVAFREGDDPDGSLKVAEFLLPRVALANRERGKPDFQQLTRSQQADRLYTALGVDLPDKPGAYEYVNTFLDAFVPANPAQAVKVPDSALLGALVQQGFSFLPQWYSAPLRGLELVGKLGVLLSGLNRRPKPDEKYFVSVRWSPKPVNPVAPAGDAPVFGDAYTMEPVERLEERGADGRQRKNVLIACLGRTAFKKAVVKPTLTLPNVGGVVYLSNAGAARSLSLDAGSPLSPDQLARFASGLSLHLLDGTPPVPLTYDRKAGTFVLNSSQPLPATPRNAVIRGDWGRVGRLADLTQPFQVCGVERGAWTLENGGALTVGGAATVRLRSDQPVRPLQVIFRYAGGAAVAAAEVADVPDAPGVYAVRFELKDQRAGEGRLEIYRPPAGDPPALVETYQADGAERKVRLYDAVRPLAPADVEYYAYDTRLRLRASAFSESSFPARLVVGGSAFERSATQEEGWVAYETATPNTKEGAQPGVLTLRDGRTVGADVRVRPRRPAFTVAERLREIPPQPFPWELPERVATQYSALQIVLSAEPGYRFPSTAQLRFGPVTITPDIIPTGAAGAESLTFTLDPRAYPNLRGQLIGRLTETREGNEAVSSGDIPLSYTLAQVPDLPVSLRYADGRYRLTGQNVNLIERAGASGALNPVTAIGTGASAYVEFPAPPGQPLYFQPRPLGTPLKWAGPFAPAAPARPTVEYNPTENAATVRFDRAAGATEYRVYRLTRADEPPTPANRVAILPAADVANYSVRDDRLEPGTAYLYRVTAVVRRAGFAEAQFPEADFTAGSEPSEPLLTRPNAVQTVAAERGADGVVRVRFSRAAGATAYRVHRGETPDFAPTPENRTGADLPTAPGDALAWTETAPLTPGRTYYYRIVAVTAKDGLREQTAPASPASNGVAVP